MTVFRINDKFLALLFRSALSIRNMASAALSKVPSVDVDATGVFKYILVRLSIPNEPDSKLLVRGYAECNYHGMKILI